MAPRRPTEIAFVGAGYIADSYRFCLDLHRPHIRLAGVWDRDRERRESFSATFGDRIYESLEALLGDDDVDIVVNLTDPHAHFQVSERILDAGKHLYTEKPLAMTGDEARRLRDKAAARGLRIAAAPCNLLGEAAQTLWRAVREGRIGDVRLVYAELDDGMIHRVDKSGWLNRSGKPWPARGEFSVGCTFEHAGYVLSILAAMFGPVTEATAFSALCCPDKKVEPAAEGFAPDFSVGCLKFENGVVARLTNSIVAPYDHRLKLIGEDGMLVLSDPWDYASPVRWTRASEGRISRYLDRRFGLRRESKLPPARPCPLPRGRGVPTMDFMRGVRELADSLVEDRPSLDADFAVHITEVTEIPQYPGDSNACAGEEPLRPHPSPFVGAMIPGFGEGQWSKTR